MVEKRDNIQISSTVHFLKSGQGVEQLSVT